MRKIFLYLLVLLQAGYMLVDGARALYLGEYFTIHGQLGPWALVLGKAGVEPHSTAVMVFFVLYGLAWLGVAVAFSRQVARSWGAMMCFAAGVLWYLPLGTLIGVLQIILLWPMKPQAK